MGIKLMRIRIKQSVRELLASHEKSINAMSVWRCSFLLRKRTFLCNLFKKLHHVKYIIIHSADFKTQCLQWNLITPNSFLQEYFFLIWKNCFVDFKLFLLLFFHTNVWFKYIKRRTRGYENIYLLQLKNWKP